MLVNFFARNGREEVAEFGRQGFFDIVLVFTWGYRWHYHVGRKVNLPDG
jgi:hypothetical protein